MKYYSAYIEFYKWVHCKKEIFSIYFKFRTNKELVEKTKKFCETENIKLLHKHPLAPYLASDAFNDLPYE